MTARDQAQTAGQRLGRGVTLALLLLCACGSQPKANGGRTTDAAAAPVAEDEAWMLRQATSDLATGMQEACIDSATGTAPEPRIFADILFFDGGRRYKMAGDPQFDELGRRFYRASPAHPGSVRLPPLALPRGNRLRPGWWPHEGCADHVTFYTPLIDGDTGFVVADTRAMVYVYLFVHSRGRWTFHAMGHSRPARTVY
jgi:hypothetical protein